MKRRIRSIALVLCVCLAFAAVPVKIARADSGRIVTLGKDIDADGRAKVLKFFGLTESELKNMEVLTINNQQEHELLDGIIPNSVIGSKTYSCAYIQPTKSGGINVKTANLTYVTSSSIYNALQTAGIENCNLIVTAPFEVSGTGALTGIFEAYELDGTALDSDKKELAAEELIVGSDMEEEYGEEAPELISELKDEVAKGKDMSDEELEELIKDEAEERNISLSDEDIQKVRDLLEKVEKLDYDTSAFSDKLDDIKDAIDTNSSDTNSLLQKILDFFKGLFGGGESSDSGSGGSGSIFDEVDTSVFEFDNQ